MNSNEENTKLKKDIQKLEQEIIQKNKFFRIIAHDLRSPYQTTLGMIEYLVSNFSSLDDDEKLELAQIVWASLKNSCELLIKLTTWSMSQMGNFSPTISSSIVEVDIKTHFQEALAKNIKIVKYVPQIKVRQDVEFTSTIIRNLISNAIKFTENGKIKITVLKNKNFAEISVADNGVGISEEDLPKIFRIDDKIRMTGTAGEEGTGLGLILCKEFVEKQGGKIWVESKIGKGSKFIFTIPLARD